MRRRIENNPFNCGNKLVKFQLPNQNGDILMAMGNSKGMVTKVESRENPQLKQNLSKY